MSSCATTEIAPTATSTLHSSAVGATQPCAPGGAVNITPATQKAAKISHEPSVLRTSRMVATAAPDSTDEATPTSCQRPSPRLPGGALPLMTSATPTVVSA